MKNLGLGLAWRKSVWGMAALAAPAPNSR